LKFQRESVCSGLIDELRPLLRLHFDESEHFKDIPLDPDFEQYQKLDEAGMLRVFTVRVDKELIGYSILFVMTSIHHKQSIHANHDVLFIHKEHRGIGSMFIKYCDEQLEAEGVDVVYQSTKLSYDFGKMLNRIGYEHVDNVYYRKLKG